MKKFTAAFVVLMLLFTVSAFAVEMDLVYDGAVHHYSADDIRLEVNGSRISTGDMPPVIISDYTMVPVREVFEAMGGKVGWDGSTSSVTIEYGGKVVALSAGSRSVTLNGTTVTLSPSGPAPMIINNKTMVPVRAVSDLLGLDVEWKGESRTVSISDGSRSGSSNKTGTISEIKVEEVGNAELIYLVYDKPVEPKINRYSNPERVSLDFAGAQLKSGSYNISVNSSMLTGIRGANHDDMARIVLDVTYQPNVEVSNYNEGIVIAVTPSENMPSTDVNNVSGSSGTSGDESVSLSTDGTVDISKAVELDYNTIVIDAGHGGKTGASSNGVMEDDITLAIAQKVRDKLQAAGFNVVMTRERDVRVELQTRVDIASKATDGSKLPCLFVSVHCNSFEQETANGTQVYYHPESRYGTMLAQNIYNRDVANTTLKAGSIHDGSTLFVIRKTLQPAALVETAFLSNASDRAYLTSESGQEAIATGISEGIIMTVEEMKAERNK